MFGIKILDEFIELNLVEEFSINDESQTTEHTLLGANGTKNRIIDNVYELPRSINISGTFSKVGQEFYYEVLELNNGTFEIVKRELRNANYFERQYQFFKSLKNKAVFVSLITKNTNQEPFNNLILSNIIWRDNGNEINFNFTFKEIWSIDFQEIKKQESDKQLPEQGTNVLKVQSTLQTYLFQRAELLILLITYLKFNNFWENEFIEQIRPYLLEQGLSNQAVNYLALDEYHYRMNLSVYALDHSRWFYNGLKVRGYYFGYKYDTRDIWTIENKMSLKEQANSFKRLYTKLKNEVLNSFESSLGNFVFTANESHQAIVNVLNESYIFEVIKENENITLSLKDSNNEELVEKLDMVEIGRGLKGDELIILNHKIRPVYNTGQHYIYILLRDNFKDITDITNYQILITEHRIKDMWANISDNIIYNILIKPY